MSDVRARIAVVVEGGVVQAVLSDSPGVEVWIFDRDEIREASPEEIEEYIDVHRDILVRNEDWDEHDRYGWNVDPKQFPYEVW